MLETGEYIGWLASPNELPDRAVAGAGVQLRRVLPHPVEGPGGEISMAEGRLLYEKMGFVQTSEMRFSGI